MDPAVAFLILEIAMPGKIIRTSKVDIKSNTLGKQNKLNKKNHNRNHNQFLKKVKMYTQEKLNKLNEKNHNRNHNF